MWIYQKNRRYRTQVMSKYGKQEACLSYMKLMQYTKRKNKFRKVRFDMRMLDACKSEEGQRLYKKKAHVGETFQGDLKKTDDYFAIGAGLLLFKHLYQR